MTLATNRFTKRTSVLDKIANNLRRDRETAVAAATMSSNERQRVEQQNQRNKTLTRLTFSHTFTRLFPRFRSCFEVHWSLIRRDEKWSRVFNQIPIITYKREANLSDRIFRAHLRGMRPTSHSNRDLPPTTGRSFVDVLRLNYPCGRTQCGRCDILVGVVGVKTTTRSIAYSIEDLFTCRIKHVIYVIECTHCKQNIMSVKPTLRWSTA